MVLLPQPNTLARNALTDHFSVSLFLFFFFNDTATTEIYTLSLHDALPISWILRAMSSSLRRRSWEAIVWFAAASSTFCWRRLSRVSLINRFDSQASTPIKR